ncbi:FAD-binding oxidoreductase [Micromonospora sp. WMMD1102]|uniref:FAD-binding oxidoreductase n=1 Tax=Micromonospora sp. WMMD1102 TaxID=3016105 RepID=UPI0024156A83|nr:FAD-binding oxidoreductase [Micromonospora sp. WMMD1102]MDG4790608.1 FAD-binding oxidoreductase [Micromonospora sp. WMMD1102]
MCTMTKVGEISIERRGGVDIARRLAGICGAHFARPAGAADGVAGATARWVAAPGSPEAVTEVVRLAAEHDLSVVARGAGTKLDWGLPPSQVDIVLDTGRLAGVWQQPEDELVAEVGAGTPVRAAEAILERTGRRLPFDVPSVGATVGGVVAADESGPLRHLHGGPCDQLVGVSYVDASGVLAHVRAGATGRPDVSGRPDVTGGPAVPVDPDVPRLLCGSQGALGVLVSATLRVQPIPASRVWVTRSVWTPLEVHDLVSAVLDADLRPTAVEVDLPGGRVPAGGPRGLGSGGHLPPDGPGATGAPGPSGPPGWFGTPDRSVVPARPTTPVDSAGRGRPGAGRAVTGRGRFGEPGAGTLAVLLEGGPAEVAERVARLTRLLGGDARAEPTAPAWWRRYPFRPDQVALRLEVPIHDLHAAVYALRDAAGSPVPVRGSAGLGVVHAALPADSSAQRVATILDGVRAVLRARSGRCLVVAAPARIRAVVDLWGDLPDLPLRRRVKERFDPARRLAPGRYPGGI